MAGEFPASDNERQKRILELGVQHALDYFGEFLADPERVAAQTRVIGRRLRGDGRLPSEILADEDPVQLVEALKLEEILRKLHGCVVSYTLPTGEAAESEPTYEPFTVYVKDHMVDFNLFACWTVNLVVEEAPVTEADIRRKGRILQPMNVMESFEVVSLNHKPVE